MRMPSVRRRSRTAEGTRPRGKRRSLLLLFFVILFTLGPIGQAGAGLPNPFGNTNPNDACSPAPNPAPQQYGSGIDGLMEPPNYPSAQLKKTPDNQLGYYDRYGTAGQSWYAVDMGCSDAMSMVGNSIANVTFTLAKAFDRTTITVYQSAASESLLGWLKGTIDNVIRTMGNTFGAKYWSWVVILGALWLAWWGLIRKRASKVAEGTIWMVVAMVGLIWLINRPGDFTTLGTKVSDATTAAFNAALPQSDPTGASCIPNAANAQSPVNSDAVTRNANGLWVTLVCKPWMMGEFGTDDSKSKIIQADGAKLLSSQAVDLGETYGGQKVDLNQKASDYKAVQSDVKNNYPGSYSLFQGKDWTSRLAVAFGGLFAALVAGMLVLFISVALIILKIAFLMLLVAGPIFLGIGIHPGIGRVIAVRWFELLLSTLLKQAALIGVLALLLWAYSLVMNQGLPWGLQILLISLVTMAAFIYRKPFQHLFAAVGYSAVGSRGKSEAELNESVRQVRKQTTAVATAAVPGAAGYRFSRFTRRDMGGLGSGLGADEHGDGGRDGADSRAAGQGSGATTERRIRVPQAGGTSRAGAPPLNLSPRMSTPATPSGRAVTGGTLWPTPSSRPGGAPGSGALGGREGPPPVSTGGGGNGAGSGRSSAPVAPSWAAGGRGARGSSTGSRPSSGGPAGSGGQGGGRSSAPPASGGTASAGGGGAGWFGAGAGRRSAAAKPPTAGDGGGSGRRAPDIPKRGQAPSGGSPARESTPASGSRPSAPPLWAGKGRGDEPSVPFWLRPVDHDDEQ